VTTAAVLVGHSVLSWVVAQMKSSLYLYQKKQLGLYHAGLAVGNFGCFLQLLEELLGVGMVLQVQETYASTAAAYWW